MTHRSAGTESPSFLQTSFQPHVFPVLCLHVRQSLCLSNLNPFWPWSVNRQFYLHQPGVRTDCQRPTDHSIISGWQTHNYKIHSQCWAFRKCKKKYGRTKPGMERLFICLTLKQSRTTSGEINKQFKHSLQDPLPQNPKLLLSFLLKSSTQLVRHTERNFPSFIFSFNYSLHLLLYTSHIWDVGWLWAN